MLTIDKDISANSLIVTVTELTTISDPYYLLMIFSPYTNKTYRIELPANTSENKVRYDEFILETALFNNIGEGLYNYSIYQSSELTTDELACGVPVEIGFMKIKSSTPTETYISLESDETENQYTVYEGN